MKRVSVLVFFSFFLYSCGSNTNSTPKSISGVYTLKSTITQGEENQSGTQGITHYKIYTPSNYFLASIEKDSSVRFGVGSYEISNDTIIEHNFFNTENLAEKKDLKLVLSTTENGFSQISATMIKDASSASSKQEYDTISINGPASTADGLWQHVRTMKILGTDTTYFNFADFVIFQSGHYLKAFRTVIDSLTNQYKNDFCFGTFTLNNKSFTENCKFSSDARLSGLTSSSSLLINEKEGTMIQISTSATSGATEYKSYRRVK